MTNNQAYFFVILGIPMTVEALADIKLVALTKGYEDFDSSNGIMSLEYQAYCRFSPTCAQATKSRNPTGKANEKNPSTGTRRLSYL